MVFDLQWKQRLGAKDLGTGITLSDAIPLPDDIEGSAGDLESGRAAAEGHVHPKKSPTVDSYELIPRKLNTAHFLGEVKCILHYGELEIYGFGVGYQQIEGVGRWRASTKGPLLGRASDGDNDYPISDGDIVAALQIDNEDGTGEESPFFGIFVVEDCGSHVVDVFDEEYGEWHEVTEVSYATFRRLDTANSPTTIPGMVVKITGDGAFRQGYYYQNTNTGTIVVDQTPLTFANSLSFGDHFEYKLLTAAEGIKEGALTSHESVAIYPMPADGEFHALTSSLVSYWTSPDLQRTTLDRGPITVKARIGITDTSVDGSAVPSVRLRATAMLVSAGGTIISTVYIVSQKLAGDVNGTNVDVEFASDSTFPYTCNPTDRIRFQLAASNDRASVVEVAVVWQDWDLPTSLGLPFAFTAGTDVAPHQHSHKDLKPVGREHRKGYSITSSSGLLDCNDSTDPFDQDTNGNVYRVEGSEAVTAIRVDTDDGGEIWGDCDELLLILSQTRTFTHGATPPSHYAALSLNGGRDFSTVRQKARVVLLLDRTVTPPIWLQAGPVIQ
jgi:hypothetical protein